MKEFNVINWNPNKKVFEPYNVIPYFVRAYEDLKKKKYKKIPETYNEFENFVKEEARYQFWGRCEYEIILVDWPCQQTSEKWDVYQQIMMNLDIVTNTLIEIIKEK